MSGYVVGVDGGNTKTDYLLFSTDGRLAGHIRDGSCSHEHVGYEKAIEIIKRNIGRLLEKNNLTLADLKAGAFGLAGMDNHEQHARLNELLKTIGLPRFEADNDSFLGITGGTSKGYGICSINGTGTVSGGVDPRGNRLQVGGIGPLSGDDAGGSYIAHCGIRAVYDSFYRCGKPTIMAKPTSKLLGITSPQEIFYAIGTQERKLGSTAMTRIVFSAAKKKDAPALEILCESARQLAKTSAGCVRGLRFDEEVEVVLAGSVWVKAESDELFNFYKSHMAALLPEKKLKYKILKEPPAMGAVLWALSLCGVDCYSEEIKGRVAAEVAKLGEL